MVGVTGANGYVGGRILAHLRACGIETVALERRPRAGNAGARRYALAEPLEPALLDGVDTVIHAAWDLSKQGAAVRAVNVGGSLPLLDGLAAGGGRVVLISSLSAFIGARSEYGRAKLELERAVLVRGGAAVRPGLVFGVDAGGLFGTLVAASARRLVPLVGGGWQRLFVTHDQRLCELLAMIAVGRFAPDGPVLAAHASPTTLRATVLQIAAAHDRRPAVIPVPRGLAQLGLRAAELAGLSLPFRSDSLRSLASPIPLDQLAALERSPVTFPSLAEEL